MAELLTATKSEVARQAGQKAHPTAFNRLRVIKVNTPTTWTAANGDTAATDLVIPAGSAIVFGPMLSCAAGAASSTVSVGLRDATTKAVLDATAIIASASIAAATVPTQFNTGTKLNLGQDYILPVDAEVYLTFGGGNPTANQAINIQLFFVSP